MRYPALPIVALMLLVGGATLASCSSSPPSSDGVASDAAPDTVPLPSALDILLVVDTSSSMADEQGYRLDCCPSYLRYFSTTHPSIRVGIVTADLGAAGITGCTKEGDAGRLRATSAQGCPSSPWVEFTENSSTISGCDGYQCFDQAFVQCIGPPPIDGCPFTQPLEAARRALDPSQAINQGFLRHDAALAVVFVTDSDDCSVRDESLFSADTALLGPLTTFRCFEYGVSCETGPADPRASGKRTKCSPAGTHLVPIGDYVSFFRSLKPAGWLIVGAILGPTERVEVTWQNGSPALALSCSSVTGSATPPIRLRAFVESFGESSFLGSVCVNSMYDRAFALLAAKYDQLRHRQ